MGVVTFEQIEASWASYWRSVWLGQCVHRSKCTCAESPLHTWIAPGWRARVLLAAVGGVAPWPGFGALGFCRWHMLRAKVRELRGRS